jgi:hypothetical protein
VVATVELGRRGCREGTGGGNNPQAIEAARGEGGPSMGGDAVGW